MYANAQIKIETLRVVHETIDGETVILNLQSGNYYSLDGIGAQIWNYIEKGATVYHIIDMLRSDFKGDRDEIESETNKFLSELVEEKLVILDESDTSDSFQTDANKLENDIQKQERSFIPPILNKYTDMQDLLLLDPIHDVDDSRGWPTVDDQKRRPTRDQDNFLE